MSNEKGVVGRFGSMNYIPFPKQIPIKSGKNLLNYKKAFIDTWKEYYNMGSRRQEYEDIAKYNEYIIRTFGHLRDKVKEEYDLIVNTLEEEANAKIEKLKNVIFPQKRAEIEDRYADITGNTYDRNQYEATEYGGVNLSFINDRHERLSERQEELQNLERSLQEEIEKIKRNLTIAIENTKDDIFERMKYEFMREVVEDKLLGKNSKSTSSRPPLEEVGRSINKLSPLYTEVNEVRREVPLFGEEPLTKEEENARRRAKLAAILAAKGAGASRGGFRRPTRKAKAKRKVNKKKKSTRKQ